jgi:hypothetical protein
VDLWTTRLCFMRGLGMAADGVCQLVEKHLASGHGAERL